MDQNTSVKMFTEIAETIQKDGNYIFHAVTFCRLYNPPSLDHRTTFLTELVIDLVLYELSP